MATESRASLTDEQLDAAFARGEKLSSFPRIVAAEYRSGPGLEFLSLTLSDGQRLLIPREMLSELREASAEAAKDLVIGPDRLDVWWPKLDDGLYLPDFLEFRWGKFSVAA